MSSSEESSKIDLLDSPTDVKKKIKKVFCEPGNINDNPLLIFIKNILMPLCKTNEVFTINRSEKDGGPIEYTNFNDLETDFAEQKVHPSDLKNAAELYINRLLDPIRKTFESPELQ